VVPNTSMMMRMMKEERGRLYIVDSLIFCLCILKD
jgi:hypothetical protein